MTLLRDYVECAGCGRKLDIAYAYSCDICGNPMCHQCPDICLDCHTQKQVEELEEFENHIKADKDTFPSWW